MKRIRFIQLKIQTFKRRRIKCSLIMHLKDVYNLKKHLHAATTLLHYCGHRRWLLCRCYSEMPGKTHSNNVGAFCCVWKIASFIQFVDQLIKMSSKLSVTLVALRCRVLVNAKSLKLHRQNTRITNSIYFLTFVPALVLCCAIVTVLIYQTITRC